MLGENVYIILESTPVGCEILCPENSPKIRPGKARNLIPLEDLSLGICNLWDLFACVACRTRFPWIQHIQFVEHQGGAPENQLYK